MVPAELCPRAASARTVLAGCSAAGLTSWPLAAFSWVPPCAGPAGFVQSALRLQISHRTTALRAGPRLTLALDLCWRPVLAHFRLLAEADILSWSC